MIDKTKQRAVEVTILVIAVACAAALSWPTLFKPDSAKKVYLSVKTGEAITLALDNYASKNMGSYPPGERITGDKNDVLIEDSYILEYPQNPFSDLSGTMKKVPFDAPSPGDFSYRRNEHKPFQYELIIYGETGVIYSHGFLD